MNTVVIKQNRSNHWTAVSLLMAAVLLIISMAGMVAARPVELSFEWFLLPLLFLGSLLTGVNYLRWMASPRDHVFSVSNDSIDIEDQPFLRWKSRSFNPADVVQISYNGESSSFLKTRDGRKHPLSDILMMKKDEIFEALTDLHPHIKLSVTH